MKTAGIIAEFNPFHNGHKYLIDTVRQKTGAENIVILCSGNFVQRGLPAIFDKSLRSKTAIENGADVVFELPVCYSTASAETFATSSVSFFNKLNSIDYLCFGCETENTKFLEEIAHVLADEPTEYRDSLLGPCRKSPSPKRRKPPNSAPPAKRQCALCAHCAACGSSMDWRTSEKTRM